MFVLAVILSFIMMLESYLWDSFKAKLPSQMSKQDENH
jgi:uncharacterized membrane protein